MAYRTYRTDWREVAGLPAWETSDVEAYRIWLRNVDGVWQQRHEWRLNTGFIAVEDWIRAPQCEPEPHFHEIAADIAA